jgi:hypothetical protein
MLRGESVRNGSVLVLINRSSHRTHIFCAQRHSASIHRLYRVLSTIVVENCAHFLRKISSLRAKSLIAKSGTRVVHRLFQKASTQIVENRAFDAHAPAGRVATPEKTKAALRRLCSSA